MKKDLEKRKKQEVSTTAAEQMTTSGRAYSPDVDIYTSDFEAYFAIGLPGVKKGDVTIQVDESNTLIIRAKNSHPVNDGLVLKQYHIGDYYRAFQIGDDFDKVKVTAELENGLLEVTIPKKETAIPKKIEISA